MQAIEIAEGATENIGESVMASTSTSHLQEATASRTAHRRSPWVDAGILSCLSSLDGRVTIAEGGGVGVASSVARRAATLFSGRT